MKLRLHDDSVRIRLTPAEVARLARTGAAESQTHIAPGAALAVVVRAGKVRQPVAMLDGATLTVTVPAAEVAVWAEDEREGLYGDQDAGDGQALRIAVEKDYDCLHREQDSKATFPHPDARLR